MTNVYEVDTAKLVEAVAQKLKASGIAKPAYVEYAKSGAGRERVPSQDDFWYTRCSSVLRQVYVNGPVGVSRLRVRYGNRKRHKVARHHHYRAGGSLITDAFNALEKAGYIKKTKKGREMTPSGRSFLDKTSGEIMKGA